MGVRNMAHQRPPPQDGQWHPELLYPGDVAEKAKTSRAMAGMEPYAPRGAGPAPKERFTGHVARHDCPARDVMLWRNLEWWRGQQALSARVGARHPHQYNATVDVERQLSAVATEQWMQLAGDRLRWYHLQEEFVRKWTSRGTTRRTAAQTVFSDRQSPLPTPSLRCTYAMRKDGARGPPQWKSTATRGASLLLACASS